MKTLAGFWNRITGKQKEAPLIPSELSLLLERASKLMALGKREALVDLQRLVMRPIQSDHMLSAYLRPDHSATCSFDKWRHFGLSYIPDLEMSFIDFLMAGRSMSIEQAPKAALGRDIVLPTCWHPSSIINVLGSIGEGRCGGSWKQDPNHHLDYWFPLNIFWVGGGNHSIMQGILIAEGDVTPEEAYDLTPLYEHVAFNGDNWISKATNENIGKPRYKELGYIYEIGRLLITPH